MITHIELSGKSDARGRNGWFKPVRINRWPSRRGFYLGVDSKRPGQIEPIVLDLTAEDIDALRGILNRVEERHIFCPECGSVVPLIQEKGWVAEYGPCPHCQVCWYYDGGNGTYSSQAD